MPSLNNTVQMSLPFYIDLSFFLPDSGIQAIDLLPDNWLLHFLWEADLFQKRHSVSYELSTKWV